MITTTLGTLVKIENSLVRVSSQPTTVKVAYHLSKLLKLIQSETEYYHTEQNKLIKELGSERQVTSVEKENGMSGSVFEVKPENLETFTNKIKELSEIEVKLDTKWLLTLDLLENIKVSGLDMLTLNILIEGEN